MAYNDMEINIIFFFLNAIMIAYLISLFHSYIDRSCLYQGYRLDH